MKNLHYLFFVLYAILLVSCQDQELVDYNSQIKPILNRHCIACHGGVKKQGGFSLLFEEEAKTKLKSGKYGIVPGKAHQSEMIKRLSHRDPEERMPYKKDPLPEEDIELLTKWINQGAQWGKHWAYEPVILPVIPEIKWGQNNIDKFIAKEAENAGLQMSKQAAPEVLARRLSLDLIGIPAPDSVKKFYLKNPTSANYMRLVDTLLASPHFGEKWAAMWLDLARYADTKGYERDPYRNIWPYRDWLINAFNKDMPYDRFLTEQLAGDLLPKPSDEQLVATAFHRNTMTNDEGGTDNEEFRVAAVIDRVNTTWETLMGTTFACVQCHSHPYDPFRHEDYYKFMAFFNNTRDNDSNGDYPVLRHFGASEQLKLQAFENEINTKLPEYEVKNLIQFIKTFYPSINSLETDQFVNAELSDTKWLAMRNNSSARLAALDLSGFDQLILRFRSPLKKGTLQIRADKRDGDILTEMNVYQTKGWEIHMLDLKPIKGRHELYFTFQSTELKDPMATGITFDWFHFDSKKEAINLATLKQLLQEKLAQTPIMMENPSYWQRKTHVFERGSWLSKRAEVKPGTPEIFHAFAPTYPKNRLGLAQWMTHPDNPLVSRTIVNRLWEQIFGTGLVETLEDLGSQGAYPSHPELLDYLSYSMIHDKKWSIKKALKEIVSSSVYMQDSRVSEKQVKKDPFNRYLARGVRIRLSAEQVRDQALVIAGVYNPEMYGAPVMPYQPEGIWVSPYNSDKWIKSEEKDQYRRAIYTFWKRTSPYPSMINFDAMGREVCVSRRIRTNTPLQALTTLNDSVYVDLAHQLAIHSQGATPGFAISQMYYKATGKAISDAKLKVLRSLYDQSFKAIKNEEEALSLVANAILNLDEVLTKS